MKVVTHNKIVEKCHAHASEKLLKKETLETYLLSQQRHGWLKERYEKANGVWNPKRLIPSFQRQQSKAILCC